MSDLTCECGKSFSDPGGFASHKRYCDESDEQVEEKYECVCGKTFMNEGHYKTHQNYCDEAEREIDIDLSRDKVECPDCGTMVADTQLENHRGSKSCELGGVYKSLSSHQKIKKDWKIGEDEYKCPECGEIYSKAGIGSHVWLNHTEEGKGHKQKLNPNIKIDESNQADFSCQYCGETFSSSRKLGGHSIWCEENPNTNNDEIKQKISEAHNGKTLSEEQRERISQYMKEVAKQNPEKYNASNVINRRKKHIVEDSFGEEVKLDSNWELEVVEWLEENNYQWTNRVDGFEYEYENSIHLYYPDFYLPEQNLYLEVKGHEFNKDRNRAKWNQITEDLKVLKKSEIEDVREECFSLSSCDTWN